MARRGFTLIELLVVIALVAVIAAVSAPVVTRGIVQSREAALKEDLGVLREAIDDYYGDKGRYPASLQVLVEERYVRAIPRDPMRESAEWDLVKTADGRGIVDLHSLSQELAADGTAYASW